MCTLRKANSTDEKKIFELVETVLAEYGITTNVSETDKDLSDLNKYYFNRDGWFEVLENEGKIIGSYGIFKINKDICELRKMYLLPSFQGKGFGKLMMNSALEKARAFGYSEMILESNRVLEKALLLYKKYDFVEYVPDHFSDRCDLAMKLKLK